MALNEKMKGIILKKIPYGEKNCILKIFTREKGLHSFFATQQNKKQSSVFSAGHIISFTTQQHRYQSMGRIRETQTEYIYQQLHKDIKRYLVLCFIVDISLHTLPFPEPQPELFALLHDCLVATDKETDAVLNHLPLYFLHRWICYTGFALPHTHLPPSLGPCYQQLCTLPLSELAHWTLAPALRHLLLKTLLNHYQHHCAPPATLTSLNIIRQILY